MKTGLVIGLATGAAVGSMVGLLFAPKPGQESRETLKDHFGKIKARAGLTGKPANEAVVASGQNGEADYLH